MTTTTIPHLSTPPGAPDQPYIIPCFEGELWTIPTSNSTLRLLVTGKETNNAFAVVGTGGTFDKPIGFHYHKEAHDVFLCLRGTINVWANDKARTLGPGDFASVPPGTIHQYQVASAHSEFIGLIIPGGWEEFFRFIGEPYHGSLFPVSDKRNPLEVLVPKLIAATEKFDMIPVRDKQHFDPQPWDGSENKLPGKMEDGGYFLRDGEGQKFEAGGTVIRGMATRKETGGKFSIYSVEASSFHKSPKPLLQFKDTHHAFHTIDGIITLTINGEKVNATAFETVFVPAGTKWSFEAGSVYARAYIFANGGGVGEVLSRLGKEYKFPSVPEKAEEWDVRGLKGLEGELGFSVV